MSVLRGRRGGGAALKWWWLRMKKGEERVKVGLR